MNDMFSPDNLRWLFSIGFAVFGWFMRGMLTDIKAIAQRLAAMELKVGTDYLTRVEFERKLEAQTTAIFDKIDRLGERIIK